MISYASGDMCQLLLLQKEFLILKQKGKQETTTIGLIVTVVKTYSIRI